MKAKIKSNGLLIPKRFLKGAKSAEIVNEKGKIVIFPSFQDDPIMSLGQNPGHSGIGDISINHDKYSY